MSAGMPFLFQVHRTNSGRIFVDGAIINNFPLNLFDEKQDRETPVTTLAFKITNEEKAASCSRYFRALLRANYHSPHGRARRPDASRERMSPKEYG